MSAALGPRLSRAARRALSLPALRALADRDGARRQAGQALTESSLLLATLLGGLAVGGVWLMRTHPEMLKAFDIHVRGFYYLLSLPFP